MAGHKDGKVAVWDVAARKRARLIEFPKTSRVEAVAIPSDGKPVAAAGRPALDRVVTVWDRATGKEKAQLPWRQHLLRSVGGMAFSPDGKTVVMAGRGAGLGIRLGGHAPGTVQTEGDVPRGVVNDTSCTALSPDGKALAVGNRSVFLWDLTRKPKK